MILLCLELGRLAAEPKTLRGKRNRTPAPPPALIRRRPDLTRRAVESQFDSRRTSRSCRPQDVIRRAARGLKTTPHRSQERVARERAIDADATAGNTAEERVKRD